MTEIGVPDRRQDAAQPLSARSEGREDEGAASELPSQESPVEGEKTNARKAASPPPTWAAIGRPLLSWLSAVFVALVLGSAMLVAVIRWVDPPASAFMAQHALNVWRLDQTPPYYRHQWIEWARIPQSIQLAAIAGEDQRFPSHLGFDLIEIRHAVADYLRGGHLRGASTITQQTAKNLFLWPGSGWWRKLAEGWLTLLMETLWPKERILEVYLNIAQFSPSTYGIEASAQRYFHHSASDLTPEEAALLIAVLPAPGNFSLEHPSERLLRRAAWIRDQSSRLGGARYLGRL
ncbi:monofunctional biosynthetic peptidoglycan transglycosylase [Thiorhodococcus minor]|uniref:Biosynthetic peptidoglycan transglycosylase n=1 Tax=Thiorhodococcus minor TaxID=57489 RepID=A0A6M0JZT2_9GAMM|nr:monofunctional biosynthetic peptidoglycan transglycosylase [Thiorhodococcus minor]NEV62581.1 monofunctional biosynthetic peptidoglycan transglycosylase [Thiorhodococcus minor]